MADRFHTVLQGLPTDRSAMETYPSRLALAAQLTVGADGAGLSVIDERHRVPIGASDDRAATAERLQFTIADGPCLDALRNSRAVRVDEHQMSVEWPMFHAQLVESSDYRSVVAVPMLLASGLRGALDIYFTAPSMPSYAVLSEALAVVREVAGLLEHIEGATEGDGPLSDGELPAWTFGPQARRRIRTWIAVGIIVVELDLSVDDALARLRGHAYAAGLNVESLAIDLVSGAVRVADLDVG